MDQKHGWRNIVIKVGVMDYQTLDTRQLSLAISRRPREGEGGGQAEGEGGAGSPYGQGGGGYSVLVTL